MTNFTTQIYFPCVRNDGNEKPVVKLYMTPMLPKALDEIVLSEEFRSDPRALIKVKLWICDVLSALDYLH